MRIYSSRHSRAPIRRFPDEFPWLGRILHSATPGGKEYDLGSGVCGLRKVAKHRACDSIICSHIFLPQKAAASLDATSGRIHLRGPHLGRSHGNVVGTSAGACARHLCYPLLTNSPPCHRYRGEPEKFRNPSPCGKRTRPRHKTCAA